MHQKNIPLSTKLFALAAMDPDSPQGIALKMLAEQQARDEKRKASQNARKAKSRAKSVTVTPPVTVTVTVTNKEQIQQLEPVNVTNPENGYISYNYIETIKEEVIRKKESKKECAREGNFDLWYEAYPRKTAKADAKKAYLKALKRASADQIMDGLNRYKASIAPDFDPKFHPYPATWLNRGRWEDEYPVVPLVAKPRTWREERKHVLDKLKQFADSPDRANEPQVGGPLGQSDNPFISNDWGRDGRVRSGLG